MGITNYPSAGSFVERDAYLPEGWRKQVCSDSQGNGYISYISPNGDTFRSRKAVDEHLATLVKSMDSVEQESGNVNAVVDNDINEETGESDSSVSVGDLTLSKLAFDSDDEDSDDEVDDNQCTICGKAFDEDKGLVLHVEDVHKDYYFDEDNSLLLKEDLVSKENSVSKCKLCLENFKNEDLHGHIKGLHPSDYKETDSNVIHGETEQNNDTKGELDNEQKEDIDMETNAVEETEEKEDELESLGGDQKEEIDMETDKIEEPELTRSLEANYETDIDDDEDEVDDNQCTICGKIYEEDNKGLIVHVEEVHKDYYFDEDNSLLLREDFVSKEKCKLCLENFKNEDLQQHMKGMHPSDYEETDIKINNVKSDQHEETNMETDNIEETHLKQSVLGNEIINKQFQTQSQRVVKNIIIDDDDNEGENNSVEEPMVSEQKNSPKHTFTDASLKSFIAPLPMKPESGPAPIKIEAGPTPIKTEAGPAPIKTEAKIQSQSSNGQSLPTNKPAVTGREAPYRCNLCDIKYYVRSHLQVHNERMHKKCKWKCDVCLTVHTNEGELKEHNATPQHEYRTRTLMAKQPQISYQPNQNSQFPRQLNQNALPLPNRQTNQNQLSLLNQQAQYLSNNKLHPRGSGPKRPAQLNPDKWNPQGDISQLSADKWPVTPQSNPATQNKTNNTEYNPPQYVPQPRSRTYELQEPKPDVKSLIPQPIVPQEVKPAPPPSPPRPMDPVTKSHLAKVSQICRDLRLFDYPVPVTPSSKEMFKDPQAFGLYLLPLLMSVNPHAKMQDLAILGKAKWAQLLESQTGAIESPATSTGSVGVVYTSSLVEHTQHLQILQSMGVQ